MSREPHGFVVIPLGRDGEPTGVALWESDPDVAAKSFCEYQAGDGAYLMQLYRSAEVEDNGGAHAAEREATCPPKSSSAT
jgi:hypothetical protein